jgi:hypothetical protein
LPPFLIILKVATPVLNLLYVATLTHRPKVVRSGDRRLVRYCLGGQVRLGPLPPDCVRLTRSDASGRLSRLLSSFRSSSSSPGGPTSTASVAVSSPNGLISRTAAALAQHKVDAKPCHLLSFLLSDQFDQQSSPSVSTPPAADTVSFDGRLPPQSALYTRSGPGPHGSLHSHHHSLLPSGSLTLACAWEEGVFKHDEVQRFVSFGKRSASR